MCAWGPPRTLGSFWYRLPLPRRYAQLTATRHLFKLDNTGNFGGLHWMKNQCAVFCLIDFFACKCIYFNLYRNSILSRGECQLFDPSLLRGLSLFLKCFVQHMNIHIELPRIKQKTKHSSLAMCLYLNLIFISVLIHTYVLYSRRKKKERESVELF